MPYTQDTFNERLLTNIPKTSQGRCHAIHLFSLSTRARLHAKYLLLTLGLIYAGRTGGRQKELLTESAFWVFYALPAEGTSPPKWPLRTGNVQRTVQEL